ncbi:hypothetical protein LJR129_002138 [Acidovorax sp. LjRoot129]|uniref:hypothetical protein n=1 Tax=Acidovorax sp. LjRoot129 TaxID=3342260 RepID=UPI003ECEF339
MPIRIIVPHATPSDAMARVVSLARLLRDTDANFAANQMETVLGRGDVVVIEGSEDKMQEELLRMLVTQALEGGPDSVMGAL